MRRRVCCWMRLGKMAGQALSSRSRTLCGRPGTLSRLRSRVFGIGSTRKGEDTANDNLYGGGA